MVCLPAWLLALIVVGSSAGMAGVLEASLIRQMRNERRKG
jgi:F0F1-type ATP synthase gamma subunit